MSREFMCRKFNVVRRTYREDELKMIEAGTCPLCGGRLQPSRFGMRRCDGIGKDAWKDSRTGRRPS